MDHLRLPSDLIQCLHVGRRLRLDSWRAEPGWITLRPLKAMRLEGFTVSSTGTEYAIRDPNRGRKGYYAVPGVDLVADCEGFAPTGVLLWIPDEDSFASWDSSHYCIWLYPRACWSVIEADPLPYVAGERGRDAVLKQWLVPWPKYPFVEREEFGFAVAQ